MAAIRFVLNDQTLTLSHCLAYPLNRPLEKIQVVDRSAAGTLEVENLGPDINTRPLVFIGLPMEDYNGLVNWFDNIANGAENQFTYYDEEGNSLSVVIVSPAIDFPQTAHQSYSGELLLEVVG